MHLLGNHNRQNKMICYTDDLVQTLNAESSINNFFKEFEENSKVSGAKINTNKTKILPLGKWDSMSSEIVEYTSVAVKILGVWFTREGVESNLIWEDLIKKVKKKKYVSTVRNLYLH